MNVFRKMFKRLRMGEKAQGMVEYGLILALISVVAVGSLGDIGGKLNGTIGNVHDGGEFVRFYKVTFEDYDGAEIDSVDVIEGESASPPEAPSRKGHTFTGWNKPFENVQNDLTITAIYESDKIVNFVDFDGETVIEKVIVPFGKSASAPSDPTREGHSFSGWEGSFDNVKKDLIIKAKYKINTYTVKFIDANGKELAKNTVNHGGKVNAPKLDPSKSEYFVDYEWNKPLDNITSNEVITGKFGEVKPAYKNYTLISTPSELQAINNSRTTLRRNYLQINDIDMGGVSNFTPIGGNGSDSFSGTYEGAGFAIKDLTIDHGGYAGLFGSSSGATFKNINLEGGSIKGRSNVGDLVGYHNSGDIENVTASINVEGFNTVGGLVGYHSSGKILNSHTKGSTTIRGSRQIGGLVGTSSSNTTIENSYSSATIRASGGGRFSNDEDIGGLVGLTYSTIRNSYSNGTVYAGGNGYVGGLAGRIGGGVIEDSYSNTYVSGNKYVGGLVGYMDSGTIRRSHSRGYTTGTYEAGGLVGGTNTNRSGYIVYSYATGPVRTGSHGGGLVGSNYARIDKCYATGNVSSTGLSAGGLLGSNSNTVTNSYATGRVSGDYRAGGIVAFNDGRVESCYATGTVRGDIDVSGGLVGVSNSGSVLTSYWAEDVGSVAHDPSNSWRNYSFYFGEPMPKSDIDRIIKNLIR